MDTSVLPLFSLFEKLEKKKTLERKLSNFLRNKKQNFLSIFGLNF